MKQKISAKKINKITKELKSKKFLKNQNDFDGYFFPDYLEETENITNVDLYKINS